MEDRREKLYNNLIGTGKVTDEQLGSLDEFRSAVKDKATADELHANLLGVGFKEDEIGNNEDFYDFISSDFDPKHEGMFGRSLNPDWEKNVQKPAVQPAPTTTSQSVAQVDPVHEEVLGRSMNPDWNQHILTPYDGKKDDDLSDKPKFKSYDNVRDYYSGKFSMTDEGIQAQEEIAEIEKDLVETMMGRMKMSDEYKAIMASDAAPGDKDKALEALWAHEYQPEVDKFMQPYVNEYGKKIVDRYGKSMQGDYHQLDKDNTSASWEGINNRIEQAEAELDKTKGGWKNIGRPTYDSAVSKNDREAASMARNEKARQISAARSMMERSQQMIKSAQADKDGSVLGNIGRGFRDEAFNLDNWTFGVKGMRDGKACLDVMEKYERGEKLTNEEEILMDAMASNAATQAYFASGLGRAYGAGAVFGGSLPFMLDMFTGMTAVRGATSLASKGLLKWIAKKGMQAGTKKTLTKGGVGLTKGLVDSGLHTATFGAARVGENYLDRAKGNAQFDINNEGDVQYDGRENMETGAGAHGKAFVSTMLETQSELIGAQFAPALSFIGKQAKRIPGISKIPASAVGRLAKEYSGSATGKMMRDFMARTQFQGVFGEYAEEVYNNIGSTLLGDMTVDQLTDIDQNLDTFLGVGLMSAAFGAVGTGAFIREKYKIHKEMRDFEKVMRENMDYDAIKASLKDADIEGAKAFIKQIMSNESLSPEERKEEIKYITNVLRESAMESAEKEVGSESLSNEEIEANKATIFTEFEKARENLQSSVAPEILSMIDAGKDVSIMPMSEDQEMVVVDYLAAKKDFDDYINNVRNKTTEAKMEARREVEGVSNPDMGAVVRVTRRGSDVPINIVGGKITFDEEGFIDEENSDGTIYYIDENGVRKMGTPKDFEKLVDSTDTESVAQQAEMDAEERILAEEQAELPQPYMPQPGEEVVLPNGYRGTVAGMQDSETVIVSNGESTVSAKLGEIQPANQAQPVNETPVALTQQTQPVEETQESVTNEALETAEPVTSEDQPQEEEKSSSMPMIGEGEDMEPDFTSVDPQRSYDYLYGGEGGLTPEEASAFVEANIADKQKAVDKFSAKAPKMGTSLAKYRKAQAEWKAQADEAQKALDYWKAVKAKRDEVKAAEAEEARKVKAGEEVAGVIREMGEPMNGEELAASMLANGAINLRREDFGKETGYGNAEASKLFGLFRTKANGGVSLQEAGELVMQADREAGTNFFDQNDPNAGRNAILDVLSASTTPSDLRDYIKKNREAQAKKEAQAEREYYDNVIQSTFHMSLEEFELYNEVNAGNPYEGVDLSEIDAIFTKPINYNDYGQTTEQGRIAEQVEGSEGILPPSQPGNPGNPAEVNQERNTGEDSAVAGENDGNVQGTASGGQVDETGRTQPEATESTSGEGGEGSAAGNDTFTPGAERDRSNSEPAVLPGEPTDNSGRSQEPKTGVHEQSGGVGQDTQKDSGIPETDVKSKTGGILDIASSIAAKQDIRDQVNTEPTEAQKEAGNYKMGHLKVDGFDVSIENPKGSTRSGKGANGTEWSVTMNNDYGYIRRTEGADGDHVDVFLSDNPEQGDVFVVDQVKADGSFDEHKVMYGFNSEEEARAAYLANYSPGWNGLGAITRASKEEFKEWVKDGAKKSAPFAKPVGNDSKGEKERGVVVKPAQYTTKRGKVLDMFLVSPVFELDKDFQKQAATFAKERKGWYDFAKGGFMMRSKDDANEIASLIEEMNKPKEKVEKRRTFSIGNEEYTFEKQEENPENAVVLDDPSTWIGRTFFTSGLKLKCTNVSNNYAQFDNLNTFMGVGFEVSTVQNYLRKGEWIVLADDKKKSSAKEANKETDKPKEQQSAKETNKWKYSIHVDKETGYTTLTREDVSGPIPIGDGRFHYTAESPEEMLELVRNPKNFSQEVRDAVETSLNNRVEIRKAAREIEEKRKRERESLRKNGVNGYKIGDEVIYKGKGAKIHDFEEFGDHKPVLDTGLAPVIYEVVEWNEIEKSGIEGKDFSPKELHESIGHAKKPSGTTYGSNNKMVTNDQYEALKARMKKKLNQLNMGMDPEMIEIGTMMAVYHFEAGARKFADYAKHMIADCGDGIRPYLKSFYNAIRDYPGISDAEMTPYDEVRAFDVANFDKKGTDVIALAKQIAGEQTVEKKVEEVKNNDGKGKSASDLEGDSYEYQEKVKEEKAFVQDIVKGIENASINEEVMSMADVRKVLKQYERLIDLPTNDIQELVELALTNLTRRVANDEALSEKGRYYKIVSIYKSQPLLNSRDSTRIELQQYSTPTPFGFLMGQFIKSGRKVNSLLEPSAGNGALTIAFQPNIVHVNDIDERRLSNLRTLGYGQVTSQDALIPFEGEKVDAVATNPPFGNVVQKVYDNIFKISSLEGQMAINALDEMKDNGRAAIIIGGNTEYRENGAMKPKDLQFFGYLYSHYNVVDVINLDGEMYARNGTKYPVRIILIDGRKTGEFVRAYPPVREKARAGQVKTFEELYNRIQDDILQLQKVGDQANSSHEEARTTDRGNRKADGSTGDSADAGIRNEPVRRSQGSGSGNGVGEVRNTLPEQQRGNESSEKQGRTSGVGHENERHAGGAASVQKPKPGRTENSKSPAMLDLFDGAGGTGRNDTGNVSEQSAPRRKRVEVGLTDEKVAYPNRSESGTLMSVVPANQAKVLEESLAEIGDVDQFLVDELGYSSKKELFEKLAAEQIDSVALAIHQMNKGNAFIIGDMTGVGKGRQGAALIRYAVKKGKKPIYFTQKSALFADNYRDLCDIGSSNLRPFIIASSNDGVITDAKGNVVHKLPTKKEVERVMDYVKEHGTLPDEYDYALCTYDQVNSGTVDYEVKGGEITSKPKKGANKPIHYNGQKRRDFISSLASGNIMVLDESHTVGGDGGGAMFMRYLMPRIGGVTFLSATFAKRADNMPLYAMRTDISASGIKPDELIDAVNRGGVTLQEIMSKQLVQSGQMIRRERSFQGVTIDWLPVPEETDKVQRAQFDEVAELFSEIRDFQKIYIRPLVEKVSDDLAETGGYGDIQQGTEAMGVMNVPFASKMYNLVNQLLFALKADAVADRVIYNLEQGFKPVVSFTNTMEGFLEEAPKDELMDEIPNFSLTLVRALDGVMRYQTTDADGDKTYDSFKLSDLTPEGQEKYNEILKRIKDMSNGLPISPMDAIRMKIESRGYKVGEITGRQTQLVMEDGKYVVRNREDRDKKAAARDFNNGKLDVLMINKSGSTGISLHASPKFDDQRQRVMVFAQFQSDINDEVQMRGRIDRTGQLFRGKYEYIMSSIPAEQRLQMMFKAKLKSLDANTTSSQKSKFNEMEVVDFLNKYGDEVVYAYMVEHPELEEKLGDPLKMFKDDEISSESASQKPNDCAGKIARHLAFLPVSEQEIIFKEISEAYNMKMQMLNDAGENDLEITTLPLKAKTLSKKIWTPGQEPGSGNAFADNTYLEEVEVDVLKKPMSSSEVLNMVEKLCEGKKWEVFAEEKTKEINALYDSSVENITKKFTDSYTAKAKKAKADFIKKAKKKREDGKNELTDEDIESMAAVAEKDILDKGESKIKSHVDSINSRRDVLLEVLSKFYPGKGLVINQELDEEQMTLTLIPSIGTFLGFRFNKEFTLGSSSAMFATLDGRRKVEIPLSKAGILKNILHQTVMNNYLVQGFTKEKWDKSIPERTRKKAYIVTGNLMQALVDTKKQSSTKGYLVSYSTIDGETRQGILMPDRFEPKDLRRSVSIAVKLPQLRSGEKIESEDGKVTIEKNFGWQSKSDYTLKVPKSSKAGAKYFEDKTLRKFAYRNEFETKGNSMVAYISEEDISKVMDRLGKLDVTVLTESQLKDVKPKTDEGVRYREVTDEDELEWLENEPTVKAYRAMQLIDGKLYPPMMAAVNGKMVEGRELGTWEVADERPEIIKHTKTNKNGEEVGYVDLDKGTRDATGKKATVVRDVAYNPYWHASRSPLNDQFKSAWIRPNLVTVEVEIPASELTSGYRAPYSKNPVGEAEWKSGSVSSQLAKIGKPRKVILSRWDKPVRVVPNWEVAQHIKDLLDDSGITIPENTVTPQLRVELEKIGVKIGPPEKGVKKTEQIEEALQKGLLIDNRMDVAREGDGSYVGKIRSRMREEAKGLAKQLKLDNIEFVEDAAELKGSKARAKGWFDPNTGKIVVVLPNHKNIYDVQQTILHEAVAHYGLRQLFGKHFNDFLDNVYNNASSEIRSRIAQRAVDKKWDIREATEEYLAGLAEHTNFEDAHKEGWFQQIKDFFIRMLAKAGIRLASELTDNELRYILWRSYDNLKNPGGRRKVLDEARDIATQYELGVGDYEGRRGAAPLFRDVDDGSTKAYEKLLKGVKYKFREAYQDSMLALKNLQKVIAEYSGKPIQAFEDAHMAENHLSSKNTDEARRYYDESFKPLMQEVSKITKGDEKEYNKLSDYLILKHGIERNIEYTMRAFFRGLSGKYSEEEIEQYYSDFMSAKNSLRNDLAEGTIDGSEYLEQFEAIALEYVDAIEDYSGTRALLGRMVAGEAPKGVAEKEKTTYYLQKYEDAYGVDANFQNLARSSVNDYESIHTTSALWDKVNNATKVSLRKSYESGMMERDNYNNVKDMFLYYVPLRGWDEQTANDVYEYLGSEVSPVNSVLKTAKGRRSIPDNPLPVIGNMAESTIIQGNRNMMKQAFLNLVQNHPTSVATLQKAWYVLDEVTGEWYVSYPDIEPTDTAEEIADKVNDHQKHMEELEEKGLATQKRGKLNINYRLNRWQAKEHFVQVKRNGKDYVIYINGNPRAAQALNGMTNPDAATSKPLQMWNAANRWLAANFTTRNPAFVVSNLSRDLIFAQSAVMIKESPEYAGKFFVNAGKAMGVVMRNIKGKGKETDEMDRYFREFVENGGETGYMHLTDVSQYKKKIKRELERMSGKETKAKAAARYCIDRLDDLNRWAEDISRYATYVTSRQMGRSIQESVRDAKEITVNFNKKGAGFKTGGWIGASSGLFHGAYLFFKVGIQSLVNFGRLAKNHSAKFGAMIGSFVAAGVLVPAVINPMLYALLGGVGDDDPYKNLSEWERKNNLCIYAGGGGFIKVPLPIELRAFYGLGEMSYDFMTRKTRVQPTEVAFALANQITELLPINLLGNNGDIVANLLPDILQPWYEISENKDYAGRPVYKDTPFNELDPEFKRVYKGTSGWLVDVSQYLNDATGGNDFKKGKVDFNPAKIEHIYEYYFGGMGKTINQLGKTIWYGSKSVMEGEKDENLVLRNVPILNRFFSAPDEKSAFAGVNKEYFRMVNEWEIMDHELKGLAKKGSMMKPKYLQQFIELTSSNRYKWYKAFEAFKNNLDGLYKMRGSIPDEEVQKQLDEQIIVMKRQAIDEMEKFSK